MTRKRIVERLILDGQGFRAETEVLDDASFRDRVLALVASVPPPGPDATRMLRVVCNDCEKAEEISAEDPRLPEGWTEAGDGEFCPECSKVWRAPDGTRWLWNVNCWTGWMPGEDGVWIHTSEEFRHWYPDAPSWDRDA